MKKMNKDQVKNILKLYFIMGSTNCQKDPKKVLSEAISGGITCFQFREKGTGALKGEDKYTLAEELMFICKKANIPFIVNDDVDLALALGADGVHIGQDDEEARVVREKVKDKILGISVHNLEEANKAIQMGADYVGVGPIFPTYSKGDATEVKGVSIIEDLRFHGITIPIVGIGGINIENAASVVKAGADGVSVISGISHAESVHLASEKLLSAVTDS
jgi:thiamine-phosphate pyrophosphorylase